MNLNEESQRGQNAEKLLGNELFAEAFDKLREAILTSIEEAPIRDKEGVHELKLMLKVLKDVKGHIIQVVETGKMASIQIMEQEKLDRLKKSGLKVYG